VNPKTFTLRGNTRDIGPVDVKFITLHIALFEYSMGTLKSDPASIVMIQLMRSKHRKIRPLISALKIEERTKYVTKMNGASLNPT
jgi:hypothetical protein